MQNGAAMISRTEILRILAALVAICSLCRPVFSQRLVTQSCEGSSVSGTVIDPTGAVVPRANITLDGKDAGKTELRGGFTIPCVEPGKHRISVEAPGFSIATSSFSVRKHSVTSRLSIRLSVAEVKTSVSAVDNSLLGEEDSSGAKTLDKQQIDALADDPDDLKRQLQALASMGTGNPDNVVISVNGFQDRATIPPKASIGSIRINPDLFSAQYGQPLYVGGRVEITTKPGASKNHGAIFWNTSDSFMNARDPFAVSKAALGKQRYGFELTGPIKTPNSAYALNLERRDISDFAVVNAVTLDPSYNVTRTVENVPTTQHLWIGEARVDIKLGQKTSGTFSYSANVNNLQNVGAGGAELQEASYDSLLAEHSIRAVFISTLSPHLVHESRIGLTLHSQNSTPHSQAPSLNIAGSFLGGGATVGNSKNDEKRLEVNDDVLFERGRHNVKAGVIAMTYFEDERLLTNFNGAYTFGGGLALPLDSNGKPTSTTPVPISGLEQYRRALLGYQGGTATSFLLNSGSPRLRFTMVQAALFVQDQWRINKQLQVMAGLRYALQTEPGSFSNVVPRIGFAWKPKELNRLVIRGHFGLFSSPVDPTVTSQTLQFDGSRQDSNILYNTPYSPGHFPSGTPINTQYRFASHLGQSSNWQAQFGIEYELPHHWKAELNSYYTIGWNTIRLRNINSPTDNDPYGSRPIAPDLNLQQFQQSGHFGGDFQYAQLQQSSLKWLQLFMGYFRSSIRSNADTPTTEPESAYSDAGEYSRPSWQGTHNTFGMAMLHLPFALSFSTIFNATSGQPYNILTGVDSNGDGVFNDRPQYAAPDSDNSFETPFGRLTNVGTGHSIGRNAGTLPWKVHIDTNLTRTFVLNAKAPKEEQKSLSLAVRAANLINHTNVTAVGNVLGSSLFGQAYQAESGRRVELSLRYAF